MNSLPLVFLDFTLHCFRRLFSDAIDLVDFGLLFALGWDLVGFC